MRVSWTPCFRTRGERRSSRRAGNGVPKKRAPVPSSLVTVLFATHERCLEHVAGGRHPERPERLDAVIAGVAAADLDAALVPFAPRPATRAELEQVHDAAYV